MEFIASCLEEHTPEMPFSMFSVLKNHPVQSEFKNKLYGLCFLWVEFANTLEADAVSRSISVAEAVWEYEENPVLQAKPLLAAVRTDQDRIIHSGAQQHHTLLYSP